MTFDIIEETVALPVDFINHELILMKAHKNGEKPCCIDEGTQRVAYVGTDSGNACATKRNFKHFRS
jgi:hypothetical protein